jgi:hypothetical protein
MMGRYRQKLKIKWGVPAVVVVVVVETTTSHPRGVISVGRADGDAFVTTRVDDTAIMCE